MSRTQWRAGMAVVLLLAGIPWLGLKPDAVLLYNLILVYAIFAIGFDLAFGLTGMLSLGHAAMFGTGGYALALLTIKLGWPFEAALLAAGAAGAAVAAIIGYFALRQTGIFFSLTTLAFAQLLNIMANTKLRAYTGGVDGISGVPRPSLFGIDFTQDQYFSSYIVVVFAALLGASGLLRSSPLGQILKGIKQNEVRIQQLGWNARHYKLLIFMISGLYSGISGALVASLLFFVSPQMLHWTTSGDVLIFTLLGGVGTLWGPVAGVAIFEVLKDVLGQLTQHWYGILGLVFVLFTIILPTGAIGLMGMLPLRASQKAK